MDHLLGVLDPHPLGAVAHDPLGARRHIERLAGQGGPGDHVRGVVGQEAVALLAAPGRCLRFLQLGDVAAGAEARGHTALVVQLDHAAGDDVADLAIGPADAHRDPGGVRRFELLAVLGQRGPIVRMHEFGVLIDGRRAHGGVAAVDLEHLLRPGEQVGLRGEPPVADAGQLLGEAGLAIGLGQGVARLDQLALQRAAMLQGGGDREGHEAGGQQEGLHPQELEGEVLAGQHQRHPAIGHEHREGHGHRQGGGGGAQELQLQGGEHQQRRRQKGKRMGGDHGGQADVDDRRGQHGRRPPGPVLAQQGPQARQIDRADQRGQHNQAQGVRHGPEQPVGQRRDVVHHAQPVAAERSADRGAGHGDGAEHQDVAGTVQADPPVEHLQGDGGASARFHRIGQGQAGDRADVVVQADGGGEVAEEPGHQQRRPPAQLGSQQEGDPDRVGQPDRGQPVPGEGQLDAHPRQGEHQQAQRKDLRSLGRLDSP